MTDYNESVLPEPCVLLGVRLRSLSLGHLILLERFRVLPADDAGKLVLATIICGTTYDGALAALQDRWLGWKVRWWGWRVGHFDVAEKAKLFAEYMADSLNGPVVAEGDEARIGAPWYEHLKVTLCARLGYGRAEVLDMPYAEAVWDYYTFHELSGDADIINEFDESMFKLADVMHEETLRAANARLKTELN